MTDEIFLRLGVMRMQNAWAGVMRLEDTENGKRRKKKMMVRQRVDKLYLILFAR